MKLELLLTVSLFAGIACARPVVSSVDFTQTGSSRKVTVTYNLSGGPAIVTMDVQTNGVSIGRDNFAGALEGDVNRVVDGPSGCIVWRAKQSWPNQEGVGINVQLTAWATNAPPDYVVVDLVDGSRSYHQSLDELNPAFGDDVYKIRKMVLRKIPAAGVEWTMGIRSNVQLFHGQPGPPRGADAGLLHRRLSGDAGAVGEGDGRPLHGLQQLRDDAASELVHQRTVLRNAPGGVHSAPRHLRREYGHAGLSPARTHPPSGAVPVRDPGTDGARVRLANERAMGVRRAGRDDDLALYGAGHLP